MITKLSIVHLKAIESAEIPLGPITVLVGPNDSGKSTILQALMALSLRWGSRHFGEDLLGCSASVVATNGDTSTNIEVTAEGTTTLASNGDKTKQWSYRYSLAISPQTNVLAYDTFVWDGQPWDEIPADRQARAFPAIRSDQSATLLRLDPRAIARPSPLGAPMLADGSGLVGIVDELLTSGVGDEQISRINEVIQRLSPHVKKVAAKRDATTGGKELHFALRNGGVIPASQMSDGIVLATALAVTALGAGARRLLIEEPENGLHPRQLKVVADTIRSIAETHGTQIVLTTHSPLLLNHFAAEEVVVVTRDDTGVHAQRMSDAHGLDELASEMALGELWYNVGDRNLARPA